MKITKYSEFINEAVILRVLDAVIDDQGNIYNGVYGHPLVKGNIDVKVKNNSKYIDKILGSDKKYYIAGLDKNGKLVTNPSNIDDNGYLIYNGNKVPLQPVVFDEFKSKINKYWNTQVNYASLVPAKPTGWVNTKVDMEISKRVRRYSKGLGINKGDPFQCFLRKLGDIRDFSEISSKNRSKKTIQSEMSAVILLHYINEIKDFFDPSSAGFLFESFLAGLIPGATVESDNGGADLRTPNGKTYQIKLYDNTNNKNPDVVLDEDDNMLDYYIVAIKHVDRVDIFIIESHGKKGKDGNNISNFYYQSKSQTLKLNLSLIKKINNPNFKYTLKLNNIEDNINKITEDLKGTLDELYQNLSAFQYNVETILTGVDENDKIITDDDFIKCYNDGNDNLKELRLKLNELTKKIDKDFIE